MVDAADGTNGASEADLALTLFREERYAEAAEHFERALKLEPDNPEWASCSPRRRPTPRPRSTCSCPSSASSTPTPCSRRRRSPRLPSPRNLPGDPHWRRFRYLVGPRGGERRRRGVRGADARRRASYRGQVWTNWYRKSLYSGILTLAYMRERLDRHNLKSTYPADANVGLRAVGPHAAGGRDPLPHRRRLLEQPRQPEGGRGRHPLPAQRRQLGDPAPDRRGAAVAQPPPDQPQAAHPRRDDEGGPVPQPARRVVDPVPEQRLDHPRRDAPARTSSRSRSTRTIPPGGGSGRSACSSAGPSPTRPDARSASPRR